MAYVPTQSDVRLTDQLERKPVSLSANAGARGNSRRVLGTIRRWAGAVDGFLVTYAEVVDEARRRTTGARRYH